MLFTVCRYVFWFFRYWFFWKVRSQGNKAFSVGHIYENSNMKILENVVNVENCQFLKVNCRFSLVIWVKWKQSVCSITLFYSSAFYSLFLPFFVLEIFKFKYDTFFVRNSAATSKFDWFEQPRITLITSVVIQ